MRGLIAALSAALLAAGCGTGGTTPAEKPVAETVGDERSGDAHDLSLPRTDAPDSAAFDSGGADIQQVPPDASDVGTEVLGPADMTDGGPDLDGGLAPDFSPPEIMSDWANPDAADTTDASEGLVLPDAGEEVETGLCVLETCGIACFDAEVCGLCGNLECDPEESAESCGVDCCEADLCDPSAGPPYPAGEDSCSGAPDGTVCTDGDDSNGLETCRSGQCLYEHPHCRCPPPDGGFPHPDPQPADGEIPEAAVLPPWVGDEPADPGFADAWGLKRINLSEAWQITDGDAGTVVAVLDTGCESASGDLAGQVVDEWDFVDEDDLAQDEGGHGTMMASLIAGSADELGSVGVAPGVKLICGRVASSAGLADYSTMAEGVDWAVQSGASVIYIGFGGFGLGEGLAQLEAAVEEAAAADVVVVAPSGSAGGANLDLFPAAFAPAVISVAATGADDIPFSGTDLSPSTWLAAPGTGIVGTGPSGELVAHDGSSVAAALVAGAGALVRSVDPDLSAADVRGLLHATAAPIAIADFDRIFAARVVDAGAAVVAADSAQSDMALTRLEVISTPLPGQALKVRLAVENAGLGDPGPVSLVVEVSPGDSATVEVPELGVGERTFVEVTLQPDSAGGELTVSAQLSADEDGNAGNDELSTSVSTVATVVHHLRVRTAELVMPTSGDDSLSVLAVVENIGNAPEPAGLVTVVLWPEGYIGEIETPPLAVGELSELLVELPMAADAEVTADGRRQVDVHVRPANGQTELLDTIATLALRVAPEVPWAQQAYWQLPGENLIADAPWRTTTGKIPVLIFYGRSGWFKWSTMPNDWIKPVDHIWIGKVLIRNPAGPASLVGPLIYEDRYDQPPGTIPAGAYVTDEDGNSVASGDVVWTAKPLDGAHRLLWLPVDSLPNTSSGNLPDPLAKGAFLEVEFHYKRVWIQFWYSPYTRKMMGVEIGAPFPKFDPADQYYDAHFHSIAEWYRGWSLLGPAKAYGGPLQMMLATSASLGFIDSPTQFDAYDRVITTDHNTFFDDDDAPEAGPTKKPWTTQGISGSKEFDVYLNFFGDTAGEETTLAGDELASVLGRHALTYMASHVSGKWGWLYGELCTPSYSNYLKRLACNPGEVSECPGYGASKKCIGGTQADVIGFSYAAHPFSNMFLWSPIMLRDSLSLSPYNNKTFLTQAGDFVFRGVQLWNQRPAQVVTADPLVWGLRNINPYTGATGFSWKTWKPNCGFTPSVPSGATWLPECDSHLSAWVPQPANPSGQKKGYRNQVACTMYAFLNYVRDGLSYRFKDEEFPNLRFHRKLYFVGGSDAHGDFGYTSDITATVAGGWNKFWLSKIMDSAYGRPSTYVFGGGIDNMKHGRSVVTDGPLLDFEIDPEGRGSADSATGAVTWHDNQPLFEDAAGQIGGAGFRDTGRTAFVPLIYGFKDTQNIRVRLKCSNISDFGGQTASVAELLVTGEAESQTPPKSINLFDYMADFKCDGQWYEATVPLGRTENDPTWMLTGNVAVAAHVSVGSSCPGTYDAYTNPIWVTVANCIMNVELQKSGDSALVLKLETENPPVPLELNFRVSMQPDEVEAHIKQVDPSTGQLVDLTGGIDGQGGLMPIPSVDNGWNDSPPNFNPAFVLKNALVLTIPSDKHIVAVPKAATPADERFVLVVKRKVGPNDQPPCNDLRLCDGVGNPLTLATIKFKPTKVTACTPKSCSEDLVWCESKCQCVLGYECPAGAMNFGGCDCCVEQECFPLPCYCSYCVPKEPISWLTCPGG